MREAGHGIAGSWHPRSTPCRTASPSSTPTGPSATSTGRRPAAGAHRDELVGRNIWIALPELAGHDLPQLPAARPQRRGAGDLARLLRAGRRWLEATAVTGRRPAARHVPRATGTAAGGSRPRPTATRPRRSPRATTSRLRFLAEVSEAMISTLDTGESVGKLVDLVVPRLCDWATVSVLGDDGQPADEGARPPRPRAAGRPGHLHVERTRRAGDDSPMAAALLTGEPVHLDSSTRRWSSRRWAATRCARHGGGWTPRRSRSSRCGRATRRSVPCDGQHLERPPHNEMEIATAVEVARRASLAIDNARLYGRQLKVAETLQRSLLTPPPQPDHLEIAVRYQPAAATCTSAATGTTRSSSPTARRCW